MSRLYMHMLRNRRYHVTLHGDGRTTVVLADKSAIFVSSPRDRCLRRSAAERLGSSVKLGQGALGRPLCCQLGIASVWANTGPACGQACRARVHKACEHSIPPYGHQSCYWIIAYTIYPLRKHEMC